MRFITVRKVGVADPPRCDSLTSSYFLPQADRLFSAKLTAGLPIPTTNANGGAYAV